MHVKHPLNTEGYGSGDTSYAWAEFYTIIILSFVFALLWNFLGRKNKESPTIFYWLITLIRYYIASVAFTYGFIKLFIYLEKNIAKKSIEEKINDFDLIAYEDDILEQIKNYKK